MTLWEVGLLKSVSTLTVEVEQGFGGDWCGAKDQHL